MSSTSAIVLGCSVAIISSGIQSLGITLQRKSHLLHIQYLPIDPSTPAEPPQITIIHLNHQQQKYKRNMWLFGFLLFIVANVLGSIIQISTLPLIILSPLQSIGLIFNSLLSCLLLPNDHFTNKLWLGTGIISIGAIIIAYNGNVPPLPEKIPLPSINERFHEILVRLIHPGFVIWFVGTFVMMGVLLIVNYTYLNKKIREQPIALPTSTTTTTTAKNAGICVTNKHQFFKGINYGIISGTLTAHTFLFAKSLIDVIIETIMKEKFSKVFTISNSLPYLLLITMLCIVGLQLTAFNLGLAQITTGILYPLCFLIYNIMNLINDLIFNSLITSHRMTIVQLIWVIFGLIGVLCGVVILSWDSAVNNNTHEAENERQAEEDIFKLNDNDNDNNLIRMKFPYNTQNNLRGSVGDAAFIESNSLDTLRKPYSDQEEEEEVNEIQNEEQDIEALIELTDEAVNVSLISNNSNRRLTYEQNELLNSFDLKD